MQLMPLRIIKKHRTIMTNMATGITHHHPKPKQKPSDAHISITSFPPFRRVAWLMVLSFTRFPSVFVHHHFHHRATAKVLHLGRTAGAHHFFHSFGVPEGKVAASFSFIFTIWFLFTSHGILPVLCLRFWARKPTRFARQYQRCILVRELL